MTLNDVSILGKKILVGIIIYFIPVLIIFSGLWFTNKLLQRPAGENGQVISNVKQ